MDKNRNCVLASEIILILIANFSVMKPIYTIFLTLSSAFLLFNCVETSHQSGESTATNPAPIFHPSHEPLKSDLPFSDAVQVGNLWYLSGQIGMDHSTRELVEGGITAETTQTLENIKQVLQHHGLSLKDVIKVTVILENMEDFSAFNSVYETYLPHKPARTTFAAAKLARNAKIEIEVIAAQSDTLSDR